MYRQTDITLLSPTSANLAGEPYQETNEDPLIEWEGQAMVRHITQSRARSQLGESASDAWSARATLPRGINPEPGWLIYADVEGYLRRLLIIGATSTGPTWAMNCVDQGRPRGEQ